jgi:hypothetical protein
MRGVNRWQVRHEAAHSVMQALPRHLYSVKISATASIVGAIIGELSPSGIQGWLGRR